MIIKLGKYVPNGKQFLEKRPHLVEKSNENPIFDISTLNVNQESTAFHKLFSVSEAVKINIGDQLDEQYSNQLGSLDNPAISLEQEIYVQGTIVVWSRAGQVMKTFDYSKECQPIQQALFAWFPASAKADPMNEFREEINLSNLGGEKQPVEDYWDKRGPQSIFNHNIFTDDEEEDIRQFLTKKNEEQGSSKELKRRALCIVFLNFIKVHYEDGFSITVRLPFGIGQVTPLDKGIIISRQYNTPRKGKARSSSITKLVSAVGGQQTEPNETILDDTPYLYTLMHPCKRSFPVKIKETKRSNHWKLHDLSSSPQKVLFATTTISETGRLPVVVTVNTKEKRHYIWTYENRITGELPKQNDILYSAKRKTTTSPVNRRKLSKSAILSPKSKKQKTKIGHSPSRIFTLHSEDYSSDEEDIGYENKYEKEFIFELLDANEVTLRLLWREALTSKVFTKIKTLKKVESEAFMIHDLKGDELICIMNHSLDSLQLINLNKCFNDSKDFIEMSVSAKSAIPIYASRDSFIDLLYSDMDGKVHLFIDNSMPLRRIDVPKPTVKLIDPVYDHFSAVYQDGDIYRFRLDLRPQTSLVRDCFSAISCAASFYFPYIWNDYLDRQNQMTEWEALFITLLSFLRLKRRTTRHYYVQTIDTRTNPRQKHAQIPLPSKDIQWRQIRNANRKFVKNEMGLLADEQCDFLLDENYREGVSIHWIDQILNAETKVKIDLATFSDIVKSLHVAYEDYRIKKSKTVHANLLGYLLMQSSIILGNNDWIEYYQSFGINPNFLGNLQSSEDVAGSSLVRPPNIQACLRQLTPNTASNATLLSYFGVNTLDPTLGICDNSYAKTICNLWSLYSALIDNSKDSSNMIITNNISSSNTGSSKNKNIFLDRIVANRITRRDIEILTESIMAPIIHILEELKLHPELNWSKEAYSIIGRDDIYKQLQMDVSIRDPNTDAFKLPFLKDSDVPISMSDLMKEYSTTHENTCLYKSDVLNMETERLRFGFGGVIEKVRIMLDSTRMPEHYVPEAPHRSDSEVSAEIQKQLGFLLDRTLSLSVGRAIYAFGTHIPDLTKALPFEQFNLTAKILPLRTVAQPEEGVVTNEMMNWPNFHNGVAAGLRISPNNHINNTWIDFCCPPELEPHHGGVLLAFGLNGVFKKLPLLYYYRFMTQTSELALIGLILASSVAYRGTEDRKITKVLSVYIPALLFPDSTPFNHSTLIQATAMVGMGLNYMNSGDRRMASNMLREIGIHAYSDPSMLERNFEGCALAAGFSLGFITLGMGDRATETIDREITSKLHNLIIGHSNAVIPERTQNHAKDSEESRSINLDVTSPGATIALGLMYLKTENAKIANAIELPETKPYLNYVRPDFLMLRVIAKSLIMWSTIQPTEEWIDSQLPDFIYNDHINGPKPAESFDEDNYQSLLIDEEVIKQATYYIIGGACLSLGLRFAGSRNKDAFAVLLDRLDFFMKLQLAQETNPQQHVTKFVVRTCVDVICTGAAMVMAGTGNRDLISRLEQLNSRISADMNYGNHMAVSMALGLLFIGLGGYTLTTTNESIAALLCAFYPFYPISTEDNRYHLQAFRHLWVLAIDSRWLLPFDVADEKPCRVPMYLELYDDDGSEAPQRKVRQVRIEAPTVVPDYKLIQSIQLDGDRYWPLSVDMTEGGEYQNSIIKSGVIYVKRKENKRSYEEDPTGIL